MNRDPQSLAGGFGISARAPEKLNISEFRKKHNRIIKDMVEESGPEYESEALTTIKIKMPEHEDMIWYINTLPLLLDEIDRLRG